MGVETARSRTQAPATGRRAQPRSPGTKSSGESELLELQQRVGNRGVVELLQANRAVPVQRLMSDRGADLVSAQEKLAQVPPPKKKSGFERFIAGVGKRLGLRGPNMAKRQHQSANWASGQLAEIHEQLFTLGLVTSPIGKGSARIEAGKQISNLFLRLEHMCETLEEDGGAGAGVGADLKKKVLKEKAALQAFTGRAEPTLPGVGPDTTWADAITLGVATGSALEGLDEAKKHYDSNLRQGMTPEKALSGARVETYRNREAPEAMDYVRTRLAAGTERYVNAVVQYAKTVPGVDGPSTYNPKEAGKSDDDGTAAAAVSRAAQLGAQAMFADTGWIPDEVIGLAVSMVGGAEERFGQGTPMAMAAVRKLLIMRGVVMPGLNQQVQILGTGKTLGNRIATYSNAVINDAVNGAGDRTGIPEGYAIADMFFRNFDTELATRIESLRQAKSGVAEVGGVKHDVV